MPPNLLGDVPRRARSSWPNSAATSAAWTAGAAQLRATAHRQRRRLPRRLLRIRDHQGLAVELGHHRHQGRARCRRGQGWCCCSIRWASTTATSALGLPQGGNGGFTQVLARAAQAFGAEIMLDTEVDRVITNNGRATGVALADGTEISAKVVVSAADPRRTFTEFVDPRELPAISSTPSAATASRAVSSKVNFALDGLPEYPALPGRATSSAASPTSGPSMEYLERAFDEAKYGWYSRGPTSTAHPVDHRPRHGPARQARHVVLHPLHPLSPEGQRLGCRAREDGRQRAAHARVVLPRILRPRAAARDRHPARHRTVGLPGGQHLPRGVASAADVLLPPAPGWNQYRTPIDGYYQCGSGTHPGGCVTGGPGKLAIHASPTVS
jgi:phytoene dehydrogenase-like protein